MSDPSSCTHLWHVWAWHDTRLHICARCAQCGTESEGDVPLLRGSKVGCVLPGQGRLPARGLEERA